MKDKEGELFGLHNLFALSRIGDTEKKANISPCTGLNLIPPLQIEEVQFKESLWLQYMAGEKPNKAVRGE